MSASHDRLLAAALEAAGSKFAQQASYGRLVWKGGGWRCYIDRQDDDGRLTLVGDHGAALQYLVAGVDLAHLS